MHHQTQFVGDTMLNRQPVEIANVRSDVISRSETCHKSCSRVLNSL